MATHTYIQYQLLSNLFRYPSEDLRTQTPECRDLLEMLYPDTLKTFRKFADWAMHAPL